ncbi:group II intron maturase-specific domain-containing protein [Kyrpidia spormannii]|uniref:group II intron maturase-specific domain-containing protein n=1 Tax=Kyrpidia spormannii TaxID=2055160 RepID=UPI001E4E12E5|nr:group II intron maturase-specific domain-containing protein [Kyrpidia spormannii]
MTSLEELTGHLRRVPGLLVRPAWAVSLWWKSRTGLGDTPLAKSKSVHREVACEGSWRQTLGPMNKNLIRALTARNTPIAMEERIRRLNTYLGGWMGYFALAETPSTFEEIEGWIRRRLRMCLWKQWNRVRTRYRELRTGIAGVGGAPIRQRPQRAMAMAHGPINRALGNAYRQAQGLMSLTERYRRLRQAW